MPTTPTILDFEAALKNPSDQMQTLKGLVLDSSLLLPQIWRSTLFAEARVRVGRELYLLCAPLKADSFGQVAPSLHIARHCDGDVFLPFRILRDEMAYPDVHGRFTTSDLLIFELPEGRTLETAVTEVETGKLRAALDELKEVFIRNGVVLGNMRPSNLVYADDGRIYPLRFYYLRSGMSADDVQTEFAAVEHYLEKFPTIEPLDAGRMTTSVQASPVSDFEREEQRIAEQFDDVDSLKGMFRRIRKNGLYGFVDEYGTVVVKPKFIAADEFYENRAVVNTPSGEGVIDPTGRYIIAPEYDMIDFDTEAFRFTAYTTDGEMRIFDYTGTRIE